MPEYEVNVRAIVTATRGTSASDAVADGWEEYDFEALERGPDGQPTVVQIRCDQFVKVSADDEDSAVEAAKTDATDIVMDGWIIDSVTLWVDEGIDITLLPEPNAATGPKL